MSIQPSPFLPALIHVHRHADNGLSPDDQFFGEAVAAKEHIVAYKRKLVYRRAVPLGTAGGITGTAWRWHSKTGAGAKRLVISVMLGLDDRNLAVDPYIAIAITRTSVPTTITTEFHGGESTRPATDAPDEFLRFAQTIDVTASETYTGAVTFYNNVRVISLMVFEDASPVVAETNPPHSEWSPSLGSPIYDNRIGQELSGIGTMLRGNGGLRIDWSRVDGIARTRTSATQINLIDNSSATPPVASSPGFTFNTTARRTIAKNQDNVTMAVYGSIPAGSGTVKLRDTAGADAVTVTINSATPQWFTATGALTIGSAQKYDLMYAGDGVNLLSVLAVSLYEAG